MERLAPRRQQGLQRLVEVLQHLLFHLVKQIVDIGIVAVKGAPVDAGPLAKLPDGDALDGLAAQQIGKRPADQHLGHAGAVIGR